MGSLTHRDLADLVQALYVAPATVPWLYLSNPDANVVMGIVQREGYLIVVARGSYNKADWLHNVLVRDIDPIGRPAFKRVHSGFYSGTPEAWDIVSIFSDGNMEEMIFAGHSLGGARAELLAEHMTAVRGFPPRLVVTWGQPAPFKPSTMAAPRFSHVAYRNMVDGDADDVTWSTDIVGYRMRANFTDVSAPPAVRNRLDPFDLHHFTLYQSVTPQTPVD